MNEETIALIEKLATTLGTTTEHIIEVYTGFHYAEAWSWIGLAITLMACGVGIRATEERFGDGLPVVWGLKIVGTAIGCIMLAANVPNLLHPEAISIHQLLVDVTK